MAVFYNPYYREVVYRLRKVANALRSVRIMTGIFKFLSVLLGALLCVTLLECFLHLPRWGRIVMFAGFSAATVFAAAKYIFGEILRQVYDEEVALLVEAACPEANNALINCVRLGKDEVAWRRSMVEGFMFEVAQETRGLDFSKAVDRRELIKFSLLSLGLFAGMTVFLVVAPLRFRNALERILKPTADIPAMGKVLLEEVEPGDCALLAGSSLRVHARVKGGEGELIRGMMFYKFEKGSQRVVPMSPAGENEFFCEISDVRMNLTYRVVIGGTESRMYKVTIVKKPAVKEIELTYRYPAYTGLGVKKVKDPDGNIEAVIGTRVDLRITATKDILKGSLDFSEGRSKQLQIGIDPKILTGSILVTKSGTYSIYLKDVQGYEIENPPPRKITAIPDEKPNITIKEPGKDTQVPIGGKLQLTISASDDFGLSKLRLLMQRGKEGQEREVHVWDRFTDPKKVTIKYDWIFPRGEYNDSEEVTYVMEGVDNCEPQHNVARSDKYVVKLVDPTKHIKDALEKYSFWERELQKVLRMQQEARQQAGEILKKQGK